MSVHHLLDEVQGAQYVTFEAHIGSRTLQVEALAEPMSLGPDHFTRLFEDPLAFRDVLSKTTQSALMFLFPTAQESVNMFMDWLDAAGIGREGFATLKSTLEHIHLVEADLHRLYNLDLADWFRPGSGLSTRKVAVLTQDLARRPDSSFGAELAGIDPMSKLEIMFAQYYGGQTENKKPHGFLTSRQDAIERAEIEARQQRMLSRGLSA